MPIFKSGVSEVSKTLGPGPYVLEGALPGQSAFSERVPHGAEVNYSVSDRSKTEWRRGVYDRTRNQLSRGTLLHSTTGAPIQWGAGHRIVQLEVGDDPGSFAPVQSIASASDGITVSAYAGAVTVTLGNDLTALGALAGAGIAVRIDTDTWALRSIAGTASRVSVSDGDGVGGDPTIDIDAGYVGQTSITTLGTVATGAWEATALDLAYGGTNADLSATGGSGYVLKQESAGADITVGALASSDLSDAASLTLTALAAATGYFRLAEVLFADRPMSPITGDFCNFSDANTATWGATIAGGGSDHVLGRYNGTVWTVVGI